MKARPMRRQRKNVQSIWGWPRAKRKNVCGGRSTPNRQSWPAQKSNQSEDSVENQHEGRQGVDKHKPENKQEN